MDAFTTPLAPPRRPMRLAGMQNSRPSPSEAGIFFQSPAKQAHPGVEGVALRSMPATDQTPLKQNAKHASVNMQLDGRPQRSLFTDIGSVAATTPKPQARIPQNMVTPQPQAKQQPQQQIPVQSPFTPAASEILDPEDYLRTDNIAVSVRFRPSTRRRHSPGSVAAGVWVLGNQHVEERMADLGALAKQDDEQLRAALRADDRRGSYAFDRVFDEQAGNLELYLGFAQPIVRRVLAGFNATLFAYGQTTAGKTHTILGNENDPGIIVLALQDVFRGLSESNNNKENESGGQVAVEQCLVRVSYVEVYQESVIDLLNTENTGLVVADHPTLGPFVRHARAPVVETVDEALQVLELGESNRHTGSTAMNHSSSRSHCMFQVRIEKIIGTHSLMTLRPSSSSTTRPNSTSKPNSPEPAILLSQRFPRAAVSVTSLNIIDLAGSERVSKSKAKGQQLQEAGSINKSLSALGNVIAAINKGASHVPFRDSKLTRLLTTALGGNSCTGVICCAAKDMEHRDETRSTLQFAQRISQVTNLAFANTTAVGSDNSAAAAHQREVISKFKLEIELLRNQLRTKNENLQHGVVLNNSGTEEVETDLQQRVRELEAKLLWLQGQHFGAGSSSRQRNAAGAGFMSRAGMHRHGTPGGKGGGKWTRLVSSSSSSLGIDMRRGTQTEVKTRPRGKGSIGFDGGLGHEANDIEHLTTISPSVRLAMSTISKLRRSKSRLGLERSAPSTRKERRRKRTNNANENDIEHELTDSLNENVNGKSVERLDSSRKSVVSALSFDASMLDEDSSGLQPLNLNLNLAPIEESARPGFDESESEDGEDDTRDVDVDVVSVGEGGTLCDHACEANALSLSVYSSWDVLRWQHRMACVLAQILSAVYCEEATLSTFRDGEVVVIADEEEEEEQQQQQQCEKQNQQAQHEQEPQRHEHNEQGEEEEEATNVVAPLPRSRHFSTVSALNADLFSLQQDRVTLQRQVRSHNNTMTQLVTYNAELKRDLRLLCARLEVLTVGSGVENNSNNMNSSNNNNNNNNLEGMDSRQEGDSRHGVEKEEEQQQQVGAVNALGIFSHILPQMHDMQMTQIRKTTQACLDLMAAHSARKLKMNQLFLRRTSLP